MHFRIQLCWGALLIAASLFGQPYFGQAQSPVIRVEAGQRIAVAVEATGEAAKVLTRALELNGAIQPSPPDAAEFVVSARGDAGRLQGSLRASTGASRFSRTFSGDTREAAKALADAVVQDLTGVPGFATSQIAFISKQSGHKEVYIMDSDGERVRQLTRDGSIALGPKFSNDGRRIAFTSYKSGYPDIWVIDLAKSTKRSIAFFPGVNSGAAFSPDGGRLALTLSKDGNTDLYTMPSEGGAASRVLRTAGTEASPSWSPDGEKLVFVSDTRGSPQLFVISASGGTPSRLNTQSSYTTEPSWSPDGHKIAYTIMAAGQGQIAFTDLRNNKQEVLTSGGNNESPSWLRDSRHLVFARGGQIYLCDSLTRQTTQLTTSISGSSEPHASR